MFPVMIAGDHDVGNDLRWDNYETMAFFLLNFSLIIQDLKTLQIF